MAEERQVIHLQILGEDRDQDKHSYYGSMKCLCEENGKDVIGVVYSTLRNIFSEGRTEYKNSKCIIRKSVLRSTETQRGKYTRIKVASTK